MLTKEYFRLYLFNNTEMKPLKGLNYCLSSQLLALNQNKLFVFKKPVAIEQSSEESVTTEVSSEDQSSWSLEQYYEYYQYHYNQYQLYLETCNKVVL